MTGAGRSSGCAPAYDLLALLRNRRARYATVLLPMLLTVLLVSVFGDNRMGPHHVQASSYYVPGLAVLAVTTTGVSLAVTTVLVAAGRFAFGVRFAVVAIRASP